MLLSLFCGAGGLDRGFEDAGFEVGLALDRKADSVESYNLNREVKAAKVKDLTGITVKAIDKLYGATFHPTGVIGGPPCQSFSQANVNQKIDDVRTDLPLTYAKLVADLHARSPMDFFVMENVVGLTLKKHVATLEAVEKKLEKAGFRTARLMLNAKDYNTPQNRPRLFLVGINRRRFPALNPETLVPATSEKSRTVWQAIGELGEPTHFSRGIDMTSHPVHVNHWCMAPKSPKFHREGGVKPGIKGRSFKMLDWHRPSIAVAYGHREVHVHPSGRRRLSVYEAMLLQGFPVNYVLHGSLSSQIDQVSEAVPPTLAYAVASTIENALRPAELDKVG